MSKSIHLNFYYCIILVLMALSCKEDKQTIDRATLLAESPVLTPEEFMDFTYLEEGFELQLVASEPQIVAPIAMTFDSKNRIWAVEMTSFMPNSEGEGEDDPTGKIVILDDSDGDGYYESRKVFLDSLRLPRSLALVDKGILVVEPPNLWYFDIIDDQPRNRTLVDSAFATGGNVEHQPNGIFMAMDNWLYNASSNKRYKKTEFGWLIEQNHRRGQWGLTQDDRGRLFYNNNSQNLLGDYFLPSIGADNPNLGKVKGFNEQIVDDNRTFPSRPTTGVNRGYQASVLDDSLRLTSFTAACGPVIYRGDLFSPAYYQNAFVAEPAANLIKRNVLAFNGHEVTGRQAYENREFIRSDDERFRPVSLYNGPDGALYIVDMYRGVIQHKLFLTKYLKDEISSRNLESPITCGRIYRVVPKGKKVKKVVLPELAMDLVDRLNDPNAWVREKAQQSLVSRRSLEVIDPLKHKLRYPASVKEYVHVLWTLMGMEALSNQELMLLIADESDAEKLVQLYTALTAINHGDGTALFVEKTLALTSDSLVAPYIAFKSSLFADYDRQLNQRLQQKLLNAFPQSEIIAHALIANAYQQEDVLFNRMKQAGVSSDALLFKEIKKVQKHIAESGAGGKEKELQRKYGRGVSLYRTACQPCHGADGNGVEFLAPPLNNSEWVTGDKERLTAVVLYGLRGPITVNGKKYEVPEVSGEMPGLINNPELVDADLALLLSYIRNNWGNAADDVSLDEVRAAKSKFKGRKSPFIEKELKGK